MTADLLRRAAAKIRETATAADTDEARTPYGDRNLAPVAQTLWGDMVDGYLGGPVGAHAALWSPDIAELAASAFEGTADLYELLGGGAGLGNPAGLVLQAQNRVLFQMLTLARRILGEC